MGLIGINCPTCDKAHLWFTGSTDQRCEECIKKDNCQMGADCDVCKNREAVEEAKELANPKSDLVDDCPHCKELWTTTTTTTTPMFDPPTAEPLPDYSKYYSLCKIPEEDDTRLQLIKSYRFTIALQEDMIKLLKAEVERLKASQTVAVAPGCSSNWPVGTLPYVQPMLPNSGTPSVPQWTTITCGDPPNPDGFEATIAGTINTK